MGIASKAKEEGNKCYKSRGFDKAVAYYRTGLAKLRSATTRRLPHGDGGGAAAEAQALEVSLHLNIAMCLIKNEAWEEVVSACGQALRREPTSAKALLYRARALAASPHRADGLCKARDDLIEAQRHAPRDKVVATELASVERRLGLASGNGSAEAAAAAATAGGSAAPRRLAGPAASALSSSPLAEEEAGEVDAALRAAFRKGTSKGSGGLIGDERADPRKHPRAQAVAAPPPPSNAQIEWERRQRELAAEAAAEQARREAQEGAEDEDEAALLKVTLGPSPPRLLWPQRRGPPLSPHHLSA